MKWLFNTKYGLQENLLSKTNISVGALLGALPGYTTAVNTQYSPIIAILATEEL